MRLIRFIDWQSGIFLPHCYFYGRYFQSLINIKRSLKRYHVFSDITNLFVHLKLYRSLIYFTYHSTKFQ